MLLEALQKLKKGDILPVNGLSIKEGETSPPKRYNSGSMILAMENAGQLIEDEELRAQIKGSGIGTSATRAEILKKLFNIKYLALNKKTQVITPTLLGEMIFDVVNCSIRQLLNPELTASWEKGLTYVAEGTITPAEYMEKLDLAGEGGTDFRPAFAYIDELIATHRFTELKGVIYFTDGQGIYPQKMPLYQTAFVFMDDGAEEQEVPPWAMKLVLDEEDLRGVRNR